MTDTDRSKALEAAASAIAPETLEAAKSAITFCCEEHLRWSGIFQERLKTVPDADLHKFARAWALVMLGHLPTRPETCPFCIQYGRDRECLDCGYALTHGRCDEDTSAFSRFIEAFHELGRTIYQDTSNCFALDRHFDAEQIRSTLREAICASIDEARHMACDMTCDTSSASRNVSCELANASAIDLMERKSRYLKLMICLLPLKLFSPEVEESCRTVESCLEDYW
jgi:hypothetical protein